MCPGLLNSCPRFSLSHSSIRTPPAAAIYRRHLLRKALREQTMTASLSLPLPLSTFFFSVSPTAAFVISTQLYSTRFPTSFFPFRSKRGNFVAWAAIKPAAGREGPWGNKNREEVFFKKKEGKRRKGAIKCQTTTHGLFKQLCGINRRPTVDSPLLSWFRYKLSREGSNFV